MASSPTMERTLAQRLIETHSRVHGLSSLDKNAPRSYMCKMGVGGTGPRDGHFAAYAPRTPPRRSSAAATYSAPQATYWRTARRQTIASPDAARRKSRRSPASPPAAADGLTYWRTRTPPTSPGARGGGATDRRRSAPGPQTAGGGAREDSVVWGAGGVDLDHHSSRFTEVDASAEIDAERGASITWGGGDMDLNRQSSMLERTTEVEASAEIAAERASVAWGGGDMDLDVSGAAPERVPAPVAADDDGQDGAEWGSGALRLDDKEEEAAAANGGGAAAAPARPTRRAPDAPEDAPEEPAVQFGSGRLDLGPSRDERGRGFLTDAAPVRRRRRTVARARSRSEPPRKPWASAWSSSAKVVAPEEIESWQQWSAGLPLGRRRRATTGAAAGDAIAEARARLRPVPARADERPEEADYETARWGDPRLHSDDSSSNDDDRRWRSRRRSRGAPDWRFGKRESSPPPRRPPARRRSDAAPPGRAARRPSAYADVAAYTGAAATPAAVVATPAAVVAAAAPPPPPAAADPYADPASYFR